jgi:LytS/YehU family sensor histidine kinase
MPVAAFLVSALHARQRADRIVTVEQEIETLKLYLESRRCGSRIASAAFPDRPLRGGARLPSLLLQPLVENAIKYAVHSAGGRADIIVDARRIGERVVLAVADTRAGRGQRPIPRASNRARESDWRTFATDWRRPMAPTIVLRLKRMPNGGFSVTIESPSDAAEEVT